MATTDKLTFLSCVVFAGVFVIYALFRIVTRCYIKYLRNNLGKWHSIISHREANPYLINIYIYVGFNGSYHK